MRFPTLAASALLLLVAGCASTVNGNPGDSDLQRLSADCTARGGIIQATGRQTGQAQLDNTCRITGTSRLPADR